jgi:hypothetical protein
VPRLGEGLANALETELRRDEEHHVEVATRSGLEAEAQLHGRTALEQGERRAALVGRALERGEHRHRADPTPNARRRHLSFALELREPPL